METNNQEEPSRHLFLQKFWYLEGKNTVPSFHVGRQRRGLCCVWRYENADDPGGGVSRASYTDCYERRSRI